MYRMKGIETHNFVIYVTSVRYVEHVTVYDYEIVEIAKCLSAVDGNSTVIAVF